MRSNHIKKRRTERKGTEREPRSSLPLSTTLSHYRSISSQQLTFCTYDACICTLKPLFVPGNPIEVLNFQIGRIFSLSHSFVQTVCAHV